MLELYEVDALGKSSKLLGKSTFDMALFGPMLDEEELKQDPAKKLIRDMQTPIEDCSIDPRGSMDLTVSFQI